MPICKTCNSYFAEKITINGKICFLRNRSNCLKCSPYKADRTSKKEFRIVSCTICNKEYKYRSGSGVGTKTCYSCAAYKRRAKLKLKMVNYKGGKCEKCGYNKCHKALQFHHIDPSNKDINLSASLAANHKWDKIQPELDKCQLLCANCHIEIEAEIYKSTSIRPELVQ